MPPGLIPRSGGSADASHLLTRMAVLFAKQMAAAGLVEPEGGRSDSAIKQQTSSSSWSSSSPSSPSPSRPRTRRPRPRLAVAFSGGPDSTALGMLAGWWAGTARPPPPFAAVEEALRAERESGSPCCARPPPPVPPSLALERWQWRLRGEGRHKGKEEEDRSRFFSASFVEAETREGDEAEKGEEESLVPPLALVVDHGLRRGSRETALAAAELAESLGLEPLVLDAVWEQQQQPDDAEGEGKEGEIGGKTKRTLEAARHARFAALLSAISNYSSSSSSSSSSSPGSSPPISALLIGHHADDQAETVALRLLRASGLAGLGGISPRSWLQLPPPLPTTTATATATATTPPPLLLCLRPLLAVPKATLLETLDAAGVRGWARDPANGDLSAPRNRLRQLFGGAAAEEAARGAEAPSLLLTAAQKQDARRAAAAASRLAASMQARRRRVEGSAARALEASELSFFEDDDDSSSSSNSSSPPPPPPPGPRFRLRLAPLVSAGGEAGRVALAAVLDAAALNAEKGATATTRPSSSSLSSSAAAERLWRSISEADGRLRGAFTGAGCVVRPVPGSKGKKVVFRSSEGDKRLRDKPETKKMIISNY